MIGLEGHKILSYYHEARKLENKQMVVPRMVGIWLTNNCNLGCTYCYYADKHDNSFLQTKRVYQLLDELRELGVESLEFSGGGEPTLHWNCFELIKRAKTMGFKVGLLTNGTVMDFDNIHYLDYIRVSLDSQDRESYERIKGKDYFARVLNNVKKLISLRQSPRPRVGIKFMINRSNFIEIEQMVRLGIESGPVDYVQFKATHTDKDELAKYSETVESRLNELKAKYSGFVYGSVKRARAKVKCFMSPIHATITAKGEVLGCCYLFSDKVVIGNIYETSFKNIWFTKKHWDVIESISKEECDKLDCRWNYYNWYMSEVMKGGNDIEFI